MNTALIIDATSRFVEKRKQAEQARKPADPLTERLKRLLEKKNDRR